MHKKQWFQHHVGSDFRVQMKNRVIKIGIPFLTFVFLCFMARATQRAGFPDMEGFVLEGPDTVRAGETVSWRVSVTNSQSSATRTDVSISVHAISYSGEILFPICSFVSTNIVPPFIGTNLFYHLNADWYPTNAFPCDNIQLFAFARTETPDKASVIWIRPEFIASTNELEFVSP